MWDDEVRRRFNDFVCLEKGLKEGLKGGLRESGSEQQQDIG